MKESVFLKPYFIAAMIFALLFLGLSIFGVINITRAWSNPAANPPNGSGSYVASQWTTTSSAIYYNGGNVGIGVSSPATQLHITGIGRFDGGIQSGGNTVVDAGGGWVRSYGTSGWYNGTYGGGIWAQNSNYVEVFGGKGFLVPAGNVGIGKTSASYPLDVIGVGNFSGGVNFPATVAYKSAIFSGGGGGNTVNIGTHAFCALGYVSVSGGACNVYYDLGTAAWWVSLTPGVTCGANCIN